MLSFRKFPVAKNFMDKRGGYQKFPSKVFCLTVPKNFVGEPFSVRALEQLGSEVVSGTEPVFEADDEGEATFLDVDGGGQRVEGAECEGFIFADALMRANLLSEIALESVVSSSELPLC